MYLVIMDHLLLHSLKHGYLKYLENLLNGYQISLKCHIFRTELQNMGNTIFIKDKRVCIKLLKTWLETIQKLKAPKIAKDCKSLSGVVNYLSMLCPNLQKLLKPIYDVTGKSKASHMDQNESRCFDKIKNRLLKPPILHLPDNTGRFQLFSHISKMEAGSALYQIQNGTPKLIGYSSRQ